MIEQEILQIIMRAEQDIRQGLQRVPPDDSITMMNRLTVLKNDIKELLHTAHQRSGKETVILAIHEGDVRAERPYPMPRVEITEVLVSKLLGDGSWIIVNADPDAPTLWTGRADSHNEAILNYLKARLGIPQKPSFAESILQILEQHEQAIATLDPLSMDYVYKVIAMKSAIKGCIAKHEKGGQG